MTKPLLEIVDKFAHYSESAFHSLLESPGDYNHPDWNFDN